jgi:hypothetical protein
VSLMFSLNYVALFSFRAGTLYGVGWLLFDLVSIPDVTGQSKLFSLPESSINQIRTLWVNRAYLNNTYQ